MSLVLPYLAAVDLSDDATTAFLDEAVDVFNTSRILLRRYGLHASGLTEAEVDIVVATMRQYRNKRGYTWWETFLLPISTTEISGVAQGVVPIQSSGTIVVEPIKTAQCESGPD
jgi:hypothetical protein